MLIARTHKCAFSRARTTMNADAYAVDSSTDEEEQDDSESVTYVEISSLDHPEAYSVLSQGGAIRRNAPVNDLYADLTVSLAPFFEDGDLLPLMEWVCLDSEGEVKEELVQRFLDEHQDD